MLLFRLRKLLRFATKQQKPCVRRRPLSIDVLEDRRLLAVLSVDDDKAQNHNAQFTTISAAVAAAKAGDTIKVSPGIYNESVLVNKTLKIVGAQEVDGNKNNAPNATNPLKASIVEIPAGGTAGFDLEANDIVIRGFTIQDSDANAAESSGIAVGGVFTGDTVEKNVIQDTKFGINLNSDRIFPQPSRQATIRNNLIRENKGVGDEMQLGLIRSCSDVLIQHNYFTGQTAGSLVVGGVSASSPDSNVTIKDNTVDSIVSIFYIDNVHFVNNTATNSAGNTPTFPANGNGINLDTVTNAEVKNNKLTNIGVHTVATGIDVKNSKNVQIENNKISGFGVTGISVGNSDHVGVKNNDLKGNAIGISLNSDNNDTVQNNHVESNTGVGILLNGSRLDTVSNNDVKKNGGDGISLQNNTSSSGDLRGNQFLNNHVESNGGVGILLNGSLSGTVSNNDVKKNRFEGINLVGGSANQVLNNHVESNTGAGIRLANTAGNTVSKNDVKKNALDGISLVVATGNTVDHNNVESNGTPASGSTSAVGDGIHADKNSTGNKFDQNDAKKNALFDYQDESTGGGTAGTANTWTKNKGKTQNRPGLISK